MFVLFFNLEVFFLFFLSKVEFQCFFPFSIANRVIPNRIVLGIFLSVFIQLLFSLKCILSTCCISDTASASYIALNKIWSQCLRGRRWWLKEGSLLLWSIFKVKIKEWPHIILFPSFIFCAYSTARDWSDTVKSISCPAVV